MNRRTQGFRFAENRLERRLGWLTVALLDNRPSASSAGVNRRFPRLPCMIVLIVSM